MIALLLFLTSISQKQVGDQPIIVDGLTDAYASEFIFISTPPGIHAFDRDGETWHVISEASGLPSGDVTLIGLDEGILWAATPDGLASADIKINDWQTYDLGAEVEGLAFDDEYVWAGGDFGVKRLDKYRETWEEVAELDVNDIFLEKNWVWLASDVGILKYNCRFERVEEVPAAPKHPYYHIINTPTKIWFLSPESFVFYNRRAEAWAAHTGFEISDYASFGDSLFVVSDGSVVVYEPNSDSWGSFRDIGHLPQVNGISATRRRLFFSTDNGLHIYDSEEMTRTTFNRSNGLQTDSLIDSYQDAERIFVVGPYAIEHFDEETGIWKVERFQPAEKKREKLVYLDETGAHLRGIPDTDVTLTGRLYYSESSTWSGSHTTKTDYGNVNLRLTGEHASDRFFSLYYDNTDKDHDVYGFGYRGLDRDLLFRCDGGFLNSEYFEFDLIPHLSTYGGSARARRGAHDLNVQIGRFQSRLRNDFFTGRSIEKRRVLADRSYSKNLFYYIHSGPQFIAESVDTIFVDDLNESTNRVDTRIGFTVGGITGDFDPMVDGVDYFVDNEEGIVHFLTSRADSDVIVVQLNGEERIMQSGSVRGHALENMYFVGPDIVPSSFSVAIADTTGQTYPLSEFGLDRNGDGRVDPECINFDLGYLSFPELKPFPDEVYDDAVHIFTMDIRFLSRSVFYYLSHTPVLSSSEIVRVDGEVMIRGSDYIVDYTSGILLFLREDAVSHFSEIEIQYSSIERQREDGFYSVQPNIGLGENIRIAPAVSVIDKRELFHVSGRLKAPLGQDRSIHLIPQIAADNEHAWAQDHSLIANLGRISANVEYRRYSPSFRSYGLGDRKDGSLEHSASALVSVEPLPYTRVGGQMRREYFVDSLENEKFSQNSWVRIDYLNPQYPNGHILVGRDVLPDCEKRRAKLKVNYEFQMLDSKTRLSSVVRDIVRESQDSRRDELLEYAINTHLSLPIPVHSNLYFRRNVLSTNYSKEEREEEIRATLNIDAIDGLYYTGDYDLQLTTLSVNGSRDLVFAQRLHSNLNVAPGRWFRRLSLVNFAFGAGSSFDEYVEDLPTDYAVPRFIWRPVGELSISSINRLTSYYGSVHLLPSPGLSLWAKHTVNKSGSRYYATPDLRPTVKEMMKIEYEPEDLGVFILSWDGRYSRSYPIETLHNVYFEWTRPWSSSLRTKSITNYLLEEEDYGPVTAETSELRTSLETLLRFGQRSFVTLGIGASRFRGASESIDYSLIPVSTLYLNLFGFLHLQFDHHSTFSLGGGSTHTFSTKVTGQF